MLAVRSTAALSLAVLAALAGTTLAAPPTPGNLVVMLVRNDHPGGAGAIVLSEYTRAGSPVGNLISLPTSGADAVCMPDLTNHDRHLHRSSDRRFIAFAPYAGLPGVDDPSGFDGPRVVALLDSAGALDLTTRLTDAYSFTSVRGAFTTDGTQIWIAGDNASGAVINGGLRYTTRGSSTSTNLSQVQVIGGAHGPDNVRDVGIFGGQLYDCSGSNATIGKGVFQVGTGLPTSGSQTLSPALNGADGASAASFCMLDLDPDVPGVDVLYSGTSAAGVGVHKYVKQTDGSWASRGFAPTGSDAEHVIAEANADGTVAVFSAGAFGIVTFTDAAPKTGTLTASPSLIAAAPAGYSLGGIDFAPCASPSFTTPPANTRFCVASGAHVSATATGPGSPAVTWQIEVPGSPDTWVTLGNEPFPLACGGSAHASPASGASTTIGIQPCAGVSTYRVRAVATNACGPTYSPPAVLTPGCPNVADVAGLGGAPGCDGQLTVDDLVYYLAQFFSGNTGVADLTNLGGTGNPDGQITVDDLVRFLGAFFTACP